MTKRRDENYRTRFQRRGYTGAGLNTNLWPCSFESSQRILHRYRNLSEKTKYIAEPKD